jgi:EAL domain-containing protein (putative c-di-GMP-specific phosphodiesterase class I)
MDASGTSVVAAEALARWRDPLLGPISPDLFIPLAEETGLIPELGRQVLRRALDDGMDWPEIDVAVNVSAAQIHHGDIVQVVREELSARGFPRHRLEIEVTESILLADEKRANEQIRGLQKVSVKVALDDFGADYSSLQYLHKFGFDKLKIDRGFIKGLGAPNDSSVILASIVKLGLDLRLTLTAEGVETPEQLRILRDFGCHQIKGYLFSRPLRRSVHPVPRGTPAGASGSRLIRPGTFPVDLPLVFQVSYHASPGQAAAREREPDPRTGNG